MSNSSKSNNVKRISISLLPEALRLLKKLVKDRGYPSRSQAISDLIYQASNSTAEKFGKEEKAGTVTLFYHTTRPGLIQNLDDLKEEHRKLVIGSHQVNLEDKQIMEAVLLRGPGSQVKKLAKALTSCNGLKSSQVAFTNVTDKPD